MLRFAIAACLLPMPGVCQELTSYDCSETYREMIRADAKWFMTIAELSSQAAAVGHQEEAESMRFAEDRAANHRKIVLDYVNDLCQSLD